MASASYLYSSGLLVANENYFVSNTLGSGTNDRMDVTSGGIVIGTTLFNGGSQFITAGGSASKGIISSGGALHVSSGANVKAITVKYGGYLGIGGGASASDTKITDIGALTVWGGGVIKVNTVDSWGAVILSSGALAIKTTINQQGGLHVYSGAIASDTVVNQGGVFGVGDGAKVYNTSIGYAGELTVWGGGTATSNTIGQYGAIILKAGASAIETVIESQGGLHVYSGAIASDTVVKQGGFFGVGDGAKVYNTSIGYAGELTVWGGGYAENNVIDTWGNIILSSGAVASSTTIMANGGLHIFDGAVANTATVEEGASLGIGLGGTIRDLTENYGANLIFYDGAILRGENVFAGSVTVNGSLDATGSKITFSITDRTGNDGVIINDISLIKGASFSVESTDFLQPGTYLLAGNAANFTNTITIRDTGTNLQGNLRVNSTLQLGNYTYKLTNNNNLLSLHVTASVAKNAFQVFTAAGVLISSGSNGNGISIGNGQSGQILLVSGATLNNTSILTGAGAIAARNATLSTTRLSLGSLIVRTGAKAINTTIDAGGYLTLEKGGIASGVTVQTNGGFIINSGGTATNIEDKGNIAVSAGGSAIKVNQYGGTYLNVCSKGCLQELTIQNNAATVVHNKGKLQTAVISSGGILRLHEFAAANDVTLKKGGTLEVDFGASATGVSLDSDAAGMTLSIDAKTLVTGTSGGKAFAFSNGVISGFDWKASTFAISSCTELFFSMGNGAKAIGNTFSAGHLLVYSGGAAIENDLHYYAQLNVYSGGIASGNTLDSEAEMYLMGGRAYGTIVNSGGYAWISSKGIAYDTVINAGGHLDVGSSWYTPWAGEEGGNRGYASNTTVNSGGHFQVISGASAGEVTVRQGGIMVVNAGEVENIHIAGPGAGAFVSYGGQLRNVEITSGGYLNVMIHGYAENVQIISGVMMVTATPPAPGMIPPADAHNYYSSSLIYQEGGLAKNISLETGGVMHVNSGGSAVNVTNNGGGIVIGNTGSGTIRGLTGTGGNITVANKGKVLDAEISGGYLFLQSGGEVNGLAASSSGIISVTGGILTGAELSSGAYMEGKNYSIFADTVVNNGATFVLSGNCTHFGSIAFYGTGFCRADNARFDFTLSDHTAAEGALIINQKQIINGSYTITVSADQTLGTYLLATNCNSASFSQGITLYVEGESVSAGKLTLSNTLSYNGRNYSLSCDMANNLSLTITSGTDPMMVSLAEGNATDGEEETWGQAYQESFSSPLLSGSETIPAEESAFTGTESELLFPETANAVATPPGAVSSLANGEDPGEKFLLIA